MSRTGSCPSSEEAVWPSCHQSLVITAEENTKKCSQGGFARLSGDVLHPHVNTFWPNIWQIRKWLSSKWKESRWYPSALQWGKIHKNGWESRPNGKFIHPPKSENCIHTSFLPLSNHQLTKIHFYVHIHKKNIRLSFLICFRMNQDDTLVYPSFSFKYEHTMST